MTRIFLSCSVCGVTAEIEGYDPAPTELLVNAFSEAHRHTEEERESYRKSEAEQFKSYYEGDDDGG